MVFLNALGGVISLLLVVALGYLLSRLGWFTRECHNLFPRLVTNVALPPFLFSVIVGSMDRGHLLDMLYGVMLPMLTMFIMFALAFLAGKILRVQKKHFGLFCACISNPNTIFIGIPVNMALFGHEALPYVLLYYFASTSFFWTVGNYAIARDAGGKTGAPSACPGLRHRLAKIISPPMIGFLTGLVFVLLDWRLPSFIHDAASTVGNLTTPLALIFIGSTLQRMEWKNFRLSRDIVVALIGRLVVNPVLVWLLLPLFALPELMGKVFVMQSSLPVIMQIAILSAYYDTDPEFGSVMVCLSTTLCALTIPIYMTLL